MLGLTFRVECPFFACFRRPVSTSVIQTFPVVPFTTLFGLMSNATGLPRNDWSLQYSLRMGIRPLANIEISTELAKILKLKSPDNTAEEGDNPNAEGGRRKIDFPSSPMYKDLICRPAYQVYALGEDDLIESVVCALDNPARPLYLGQSDDLVIIEDTTVTQVQESQSEVLHSIVSGQVPGCRLVRLPLRFIGMRELSYSPVLSVAESYPINVQQPHECYRFKEEYIELF